MLGFVVRRLLYLVPVLIAVSLLTFLIASLLPGDLAYVILGDQATPEKVAALRHDMGLDPPVWGRYLSWLGHVLQGDFGRSFRTGQTVLQAVTERLPVSLELMVLAELCALAIGIPLAIICAVRSGSAFDRVVTGADARAPFRHDRDLAGKLHCDGAGQGTEAVAYPAGACIEAFVADPCYRNRHQYRPSDRGRGHCRIDFCVAGNRPAAAGRHLYPRPDHPAGCGTVRCLWLRAAELHCRHALRRPRSQDPSWPRLSSASTRISPSVRFRGCAG